METLDKLVSRTSMQNFVVPRETVIHVQLAEFEEFSHTMHANRATLAPSDPIYVYCILKLLQEIVTRTRRHHLRVHAQTLLT